MPTDRLRRGAAAGALATMLALTGAGCGDDDGSDSGTSPTGGKPAAATADDADVRATFKAFEVAFQSGAGAKACALLTESARAEAASLIGGEQTCESALTTFGKSAKEIDQDPSRVLSIEVDGDTATASVSDAGRPAVTLPFERRDGEWLIASLSLPGVGDRDAAR